MLPLKPDMAFLATGSVNFPTSIYENPPSLINDLAQSMLKNSIKPEIEIFDLAMLFNAFEMVKYVNSIYNINRFVLQELWILLGGCLPRCTIK